MVRGTRNFYIREIGTDWEIGIRDGDSGCWIIDQETNELYGHLEASDIFNDGYVKPMSTVFNRIENGGFGVSRVYLPRVEDLSDPRYLDNLMTHSKSIPKATKATSLRTGGLVSTREGVNWQFAPSDVSVPLMHWLKDEPDVPDRVVKAAHEYVGDEESDPDLMRWDCSSTPTM